MVTSGRRPPASPGLPVSGLTGSAQAWVGYRGVVAPAAAHDGHDPNIMRSAAEWMLMKSRCRRPSSRPRAVNKVDTSTVHASWQFGDGTETAELRVSDVGTLVEVRVNRQGNPGQAHRPAPLRFLGRGPNPHSAQSPSHRESAGWWCGTWRQTCILAKAKVPSGSEAKACTDK